MLKRKIHEKLVEWKNSLNHNPLVIKGCRQCGKTYSAVHFAKQNYRSVVYVNFYENNMFKEAFSHSLNISEITMYLSSLLSADTQFIEKETCIILDEIQECPNARAALKFFKLDGRYDVIATGSLLGVAGYRDEAISVPVGYETVVTMYPLDFEEFLWANNISDEYIKLLKKHLYEITPLPEVMRLKMREIVLNYTVVGGMPAAVVEFIESKTLNKVLHIQRDIVEGYKDDMLKYAPKNEKSKIRECFDSIPSQLAKENKKFQYSKIEKNGRASKYAGALQWIEDAGIINRCYNLRMPELPFAGNAVNDVFKVYMADIGLLVSMLEEGTQFDILQGALYTYKGAIIENLVADFLTKAGKKLYYFHKDTGLEVDFLIRRDNEAVLLECKATNGNVKSTKTILNHPEKYHVYKAIKLSDSNIGVTGEILTIPIFMGAFLFN